MKYIVCSTFIGTNKVLKNLLLVRLSAVYMQILVTVILVLSVNDFNDCNSYLTLRSSMGGKFKNLDFRALEN